MTTFRKGDRVEYRKGNRIGSAEWNGSLGTVKNEVIHHGCVLIAWDVGTEARKHCGAEANHYIDNLILAGRDYHPDQTGDRDDDV